MRWSVLIMLFAFSSCSLLKKKPESKNAGTDSVTTTPNVAQQDIIGPPIYSDVKLTKDENEGTPEVNMSALSPEKEALINRIVPIWKKHTDYTTFKGKAKMHYEGSGQRQDFTANIRMAKDSVIWIHITAGMGIVNVGRVLITPDSLLFINYLEKSVMRMGINDVEKLLPAAVDFKLLQNFIVGDALTEAMQQPVDAADFGDTWMLSIDGADADQQLAFNKADSTIRSARILSSVSEFVGLIKYGNYSNIDDRKFAISRAINITSKNEPHYLDMNFNNASFNQAIDFPFSIPQSYTLNK